MNREQLLRLAAKAAGIGPVLDYDKGGFLRIGTPNRYFLWNPLSDDGDCARMEDLCDVRLERDDSDDAGVRAWVPWKSPAPGTVRYADHDNDRHATRRWASVTAVADAVWHFEAAA